MHWYCEFHVCLSQEFLTNNRFAINMYCFFKKKKKKQNIYCYFHRTILLLLWLETDVKIFPALLLKISIFKKILVKLFTNGSSKICGRQPLNNLKWYGPYHFKFFKGYLTKFFLVHSWIPWLIYDIHNNWK